MSPEQLNSGRMDPEPYTFLHDPADEAYRRPLGALPAGTCAELFVKIRPADTDAGKPLLFIRRRFRNEDSRAEFLPDHEAREGEYIVFRFTLGTDVLSAPGVYYYGFSIGGECAKEAGRITVFDPGMRVPEWFKNAVIYQIFPDRFAIGDDPGVVPKKDAVMYGSTECVPEYSKNADGEVVRWDFFGGNLSGIIGKLGYISGLGADTVYLNPIFESVSNHRYDTADYEHVDGLLGGDKAFGRLADSMSDNGMRLILDGVFSHTGRNSRYFKAALRGRKPYSGWYDFRPDGSYECWWGVKDLPCVKELDPSYFKYIVKGRNSIVRRWLRAGASGWRLDVADELPDEFLEELFKAATEERSDAVIFGEVWEDGTDKVSYGVHRSYFTKHELHSQTNYPFRERLLKFLEGSVNAQDISCLFRLDSVNYPPEVYYSLVNMTGSHDVERLFTYLKRITRDDARLAKGLVKAYSLVQFCFPGVPLIYYGDEICMEGGTDPDNRRFFEWDKADPDTVRWFSDLAKLRRDEPVLRSGKISFIDAGDNVFAFRRYCGLCCPVSASDPQGFICAVDRFGRGPEFIIGALEKQTGLGYNILKQADGYAVLLKML
ncbi:MAG: glycoside hydrolase family 13 protein [Clostridia bacterium]|nr:glycoside hydrolase family 13 protein [Clostridia bacterium]